MRECSGACRSVCMRRLLKTRNEMMSILAKFAKRSAFDSRRNKAEAPHAYCTSANATGCEYGIWAKERVQMVNEMTKFHSTRSKIKKDTKKLNGQLYQPASPQQSGQEEGTGVFG
jgi:hypothetical protein